MQPGNHLRMAEKVYKKYYQYGELINCSLQGITAVVWCVVVWWLPRLPHSWRKLHVNSLLTQLMLRGTPAPLGEIVHVNSCLSLCEPCVTLLHG